MKPKPNKARKRPGPSGTERRVCADIARRQRLGLAKYGVSVAKNPLKLRAWLWHLYEEQLDAAVYTRRAIEELDRQLRGLGRVAKGVSRFQIAKPQTRAPRPPRR